MWHDVPNLMRIKYIYMHVYVSLTVSQHGLYQVEILLTVFIFKLKLKLCSHHKDSYLPFSLPTMQKKTERNVSLWFGEVGFLACIKHFMGLVDRIEGRKLTHMRYNELWPVLDGFSMVKILELGELFSLCLGTLYPWEDRKRPDKAVLTPKAILAATNSFQIWKQCISKLF